MRLGFAAFSAQGYALAQRLAQVLGGTATRCGVECPLRDWIREAFAQYEGLVFVGAVGIAVRAIAPYVQSKTTDPAVVVVDEGGRFVIPLLSGHLGGANGLAHRIAAAGGGSPVITTATDGRGLFAVDSWERAELPCDGAGTNQRSIRKTAGGGDHLDALPVGGVRAAAGRGASWGSEGL